MSLIMKITATYIRYYTYSLVLFNDALNCYYYSATFISKSIINKVECCKTCLTGHTGFNWVIRRHSPVDIHTILCTHAFLCTRK